MSQNKSSDLFKTVSIIMALALPTMLEQLMQTAVLYIDTAMVGALGTDATASVGSTVTVNWLVNSTVSALGIGFLSQMAQALGARDREKAKKISSQAVLACLVIGSLFTILTLAVSPFIPRIMQVDSEISRQVATYFFIIYLPMLPRSATLIFGTLLRAASDTKTPMRVGIVVNVTNVILNTLLIFPSHTINIFNLNIFIPGLNLGVTGAAIASAIAFTVGGILITLALFRHPDISPCKIKLLPDREILSPCLKVAFPNMVQRFTTSLGYVAFAAMVNSLGQTATAAHTIANTVESAFYIPGYGMQTAAATLAGNALGASDSRKMKAFSSITIRIEIILMIISGGLLFAFAPAMASLFSRDAAVISLCATVLRMVALSEPVYGVSIIIEGILQGVGETVYPLKINIFGMWFIRNIGTFICINLFNMSLVSAWSCMIAHNCFLFIMFLIYYKKGKWNPLKNPE